MILILTCCFALTSAVIEPPLEPSESPDFRILGGIKATKDDYPPIVSLSYHMSQEELESNHSIWAPIEGGHWHFCGGTIVHRHWVLTAAHCMEGKLRILWKLRVRVGFIDLSIGKQLEDGEANFEVEKYILHPDYDSFHKKYRLSDDIALVKIKGRFENSRIARLQTLDIDMEGLEATALGWGRTGGASDIQSKSIFLMKVKGKICDGNWAEGLTVKLNYRNISSLKKEIMCHGLESGRGVCHGDSGGPLIYGAKNRMLGVASFIYKPCGTAGFFQKVNFRIGWIQKTIGEKMSRNGYQSSGVLALAVELRAFCFCFVLLVLGYPPLPALQTDLV